MSHINIDPTLSTRQLSAVSSINHTNIWSILKTYKFHPYKIHLVQDINEDIFYRRLHFCELIREQIINNPNLFFNIRFSYECSFFLNGTVNRHNCRDWLDETPHSFNEGHTQHPQETLQEKYKIVTRHCRSRFKIHCWSIVTIKWSAKSADLSPLIKTNSVHVDSIKF